MMRPAVGATAGACCLAAALSAAQAVAEFEVVSVRRAAAVSTSPVISATRPGRVTVLPDGRFEARGESLANLARVAFGFDHVDPSRGVVKAADWMWTDRFDVTASAGQPWTTPPPGTTVPGELRTMLRALLEERFALKARIETKKVDVTVLRRARKLGPGLRSSTAVCRGAFTNAAPDEAPPRPRCRVTNESDRIEAEGVTMQEVAQLLSQDWRFASYGAIVDQTGLPGVYDISFTLHRWSNTSEKLIVELEVQLGVTLKGARLPLPTLIIERASKPRED